MEIRILGAFKGHEGHFFADYSDEEIPIGTYFGEIRLMGVMNQLFHQLDAIPRGWKTIVVLDGELPEEFKNLPKVNGWKLNKNYITLTNDGIKNGL